MKQKQELLNVAILSCARTAIGRAHKGALANERPDDMAAFVMQAALQRANIQPQDMEDVVLGCAMPEAEQGMNVARIAACRAGLPYHVPACSVNRFCASGLQAVAQVAQAIETGQINIGLAGGVESMSAVPMGGHLFRANPYLIKEQPTIYMPMGLTAERVAKKCDISRADQDTFALHSHEKAVKAQQQGWFDDEIAPLPLPLGGWQSGKQTADQNERMFTHDECPRSDTSLQALQKLKPAFAQDGSVTAGNSSPLNDGAAVVALMQGNQAKQENRSIMGWFRAFVTVGLEPEIMGLGPVEAVKKLLALTGLSLQDIGVIELNEAFAAQAVACIRKLEMDPNKINPCGGAIALGHPLGCTGARQVGTMLHYMKKQQIALGICTMCVGGGMGAAALIELAQ
ncbi:MAG: thiolase family protein [Myxococcota bacterium]